MTKKVKVKLGTRPETFMPFDVNFKLPDGSESSIKATFAYRTRAEFGQMLNGVFKEAGEDPPTDGKLDFEAIYRKAGDKNADHLLACLKAWDLDDDLTRANLLTLSNEIPGAAVALMAAYSDCCTQGKLGN